MAAPATLVTQAELGLAYGADTVKQLLPNAGKNAPDTDRVALVLRSATGWVLGKVQIQLKTLAIDTWWDAATTTERDKALLKDLTLLWAAWYMRHYGQKGEEIPQAVVDAATLAEKRLDEIAQHLASIGSSTQPDAATQNEFLWNSGAGIHATGSPRSRWGGF